MTTDKELLEMAARAVGFRVMNEVVDADDNVIALDCKTTGKNLPRFRWAPLIDDGDCLRLATRLGLTIKWDGDEAQVSQYAYDSRNPICACEIGEDAGATLRRAIVKCAAEIGRAMK